ncbi:tlde1 domain-containing protein [Bradyrhizobium sp.]|uniref:tlde1 domain-containing protein n=1 Tax=Bradyrhizobium sp. TaxID=376 RepID=UPI004037B058
MSTSSSAFGLPARKRRHCRQSRFTGFAGAAAVAALVIGCGWTVYKNILGAGIYPSIHASVEVPVAKRQMSSVVRKTPAHVITTVFGDLPQATTSVPNNETVAAVPSVMFNERFAAASADGVAPQPVQGPQLASASPAVEVTLPAEPAKKQSASASVQIAMATPSTKSVEAKPVERVTGKSGRSIRDMAQRAKAAVMSIGQEKPSMVEKLWGKEPAHGALLAYASADISVTGSIAKEQNPMLGGKPPYDKETAVYVITSKTVYLPDGTQLEAHSGLGSKMDDPRFSHVRMQGVTPPHIYTLKPREALFHGVPALRLTPIGGEDKIFGRDGLLAHTYMLGGTGQSNGCVSFKDYYAFLDAYKNKGIRKIAVIARLD